jgi:hypothetical protein
MPYAAPVGHFDASAPWVLKKNDPARMLEVLAVSLEVTRCVALAYQPFMPRAMEKLLTQIGATQRRRRKTRHRARTERIGFPGKAPSYTWALPKTVPYVVGAGLVERRGVGVPEAAEYRSFDAIRSKPIAFETRLATPEAIFPRIDVATLSAI